MEVFEAALKFARSEGIVPAPEPSHAIAAVDPRSAGGERSRREAHHPVQPVGHGHFDMAAYEAYLGGSLTDYEYPQEEIEAAMAHLPVI